jgi:hypothetical protein
MTNKQTDWRALCADLIQLEQEQPAEYSDWKKRWNAAVSRTRAALAQPEPQGAPKNCWLDDEPDLLPTPCVFDDPFEVVENCVYAQQAKCKTDCKYYRQPTREDNFDG